MLGQRHADGVEVGVEVRQGRQQPAGADHREDADHRDLGADSPAETRELVVERDGQRLVRRQHRGRRLGVVRERRAGRLGQPAAVGRQRHHRAGADAEPRGLRAHRLQEQGLVVRGPLADRDRQAAMPVAHEGANGLRGGRFDVEIDERIALEPGAAAEGHELDALGLHPCQARVVGGSLADDDRIGDSPLHDALQVAERVLVGAAEQHDQVERAPLKRSPRPLQNGEEPRVGLRCDVMARDHRGGDAGAAAAQAAARLVGHVARAQRRLLHPRPRLGVDVRAIVERPRHRPDRQPELAGQLADSHLCASSPAVAVRLCRDRI